MCASRPPINLVLTILLFGLRGGGLSLIHTWGAKTTDFENEVFYPLLSDWESKCIFFFLNVPLWYQENTEILHPPQSE